MTHGYLTLEALLIALGTGPMSLTSCLPGPTYWEHPGSDNICILYPSFERKEKVVQSKCSRKGEGIYKGRGTGNHNGERACPADQCECYIMKHIFWQLCVLSCSHELGQVSQQDSIGPVHSEECCSLSALSKTKRFGVFQAVYHPQNEALQMPRL